MEFTQVGCKNTPQEIGQCWGLRDEKYCFVSWRLLVANNMLFGGHRPFRRGCLFLYDLYIRLR